MLTSYTRNYSFYWPRNRGSIPGKGHTKRPMQWVPASLFAGGQDAGAVEPGYWLPACVEDNALHRALKLTHAFMACTVTTLPFTFNLIIVLCVFLFSPYFYITPSSLSIWIPWRRNTITVLFDTDLNCGAFMSTAMMQTRSIRYRKYPAEIITLRACTHCLWSQGKGLPNDSSLVRRKGKAAHAIKTYGGVQAWLLSLLNPALDGHDKVRTLAVLSPQNGPGTHWMGGLVGPRHGQVLGKIKMYCFCQESAEARFFLQSMDVRKADKSETPGPVRGATLKKHTKKKNLRS
jgi:hypothetical protein